MESLKTEKNAKEQYFVFVNVLTCANSDYCGNAVLGANTKTTK